MSSIGIGIAQAATSATVINSASAPMIYSYPTIVGMKKRYPYKTAVLGWFLDYYKNIVTEDKKNPLFFRTKIYQAFPQNPFHKFKNIRKVGDRWMVGNNNSYQELQSVDRAERDKIHRLIRTKLNQITDINFNQIKEELIHEIMNIEVYELYDILVSEIYDKFIFEKKFQDGYIKLIKQINKKAEISKKLVTISIDENNQFYWFVNTSDSQFNMNTGEQINGPFDTEEKVNESIEKNIQLKFQLIEFIQKQFNKRDEYIREIRRLSEKSEDDPDSNDEIQENIFRIRRNIFGAIEMAGRLYYEKVISINVIHNMLLSLFHFHEYERKRRISANIASEEIEAMILLWNYINENLKNSKNEQEREYYNEYIYLFEQIRKINKDTRIGFLLMDIFDGNGGNDSCNEKEKLNNVNKAEEERGEGGEGDEGNDWEDNINEEENKITKYMTDYLEHQQIERVVNQMVKAGINLNLYVKNMILFSLENMDKSRILRTLWRIILSDKMIKMDSIAKIVSEMEAKADDWELDFPDFMEKLTTIRGWIM